MQTSECHTLSIYTEVAKVKIPSFFLELTVYVLYYLHSLFTSGSKQEASETKSINFVLSSAHQACALIQRVKRKFLYHHSVFKQEFPCRTSGVIRF